MSLLGGLAACGSDSESPDVAEISDTLSDISAPDASAPDVSATDLSVGPDLSPEVVTPPAGTCPALDGAAGDTPLFRPECVRTVALTMAEADWQALRAETRTIADIVAGDCLASPPESPFSWYAAALTVDGVAIGDVAVRKKGFLGSLSDVKPSLRIALNRPQTGLAFEGDDRFVLNNMRQDPGLINTCLGYALLADAGVPAPRCGFVRVSLNGRDLGIYAQVESIAEPFLARHFAFTTGNLYEATLSDFRPEFRGTWAKKTNEVRDDWSDLDRAVTRLAAPDEALLSEAAKSFDLEAFYRFWAAEVLLGHWDGYAGNLNNTWLYEDPATQTFHFLPWGMDAVFGPNPNDEVSPPGAGGLYANGHLARRLYLLDEGRAAFQAALRGLLATIWDEEAIVGRIDAMEDLILPQLDATTAAAVRQAVSAKRAWVFGRRGALSSLVGDAPPEWTAPERASICWNEVGAVTATFDTRWGTSGLDFLGARATLAGTVDGAELRPGNVTSNARAVDEPGVEDRAVVEVFGRGAGTTLHALVVRLPMMSVDAGVEVPIDWAPTEGYLGLFDTVAQSFELQGFLLGGTLVFDDAFPIAGEPVRGRIDAPVLRAP